jgi:hypothetical protein
MEIDENDAPLLSEVERLLKQRFEKDDNAVRGRVASTAKPAPKAARIEQLILPDNERPRMPFTKESYLVRENPQRVQWERELRKFLRNLSPQHEHRIAAVHVYEWATGLKIAELMQLERQGTAGRASWRSDLRHLNWLLREYFGKPYMTWIMGRKIPKAYRVPNGWYVYRHRPKTLTLYAEWASGIKL